MKEYLVLSGLGPDKPGIVSAISEAVYQQGCGIVDSRMAVLGGEFAILVLIESDKKALDSFTGTLGKLESATGLTLAAKPTRKRADFQVEQALAYRISVVGMDRGGIVFRITDLLSGYGINIDSLETEAGHAPISGTPIFRMELSLLVPAEVSLRGLREKLAALCDELNMDFTLEALG